MIILFMTILFNLLPLQDTVQKLDQLKWKNRLVLYFPIDENSEFEFPDSLMTELEERKVAYFMFKEKYVVSNLPTKFSENYQKALLKKYKMGSKTDCLVVIGLDGGVKLKKEEELDWNLIMQTIDSMPMRIYEMKNN